MRKNYMKRIGGGYLILVLAIISIFTFASMAWAVDKVICVPWQGNPLKQHTIVNTQAAQLKCVVKTDSASTRWYKWSFGDGTPDTAVSSVTGSTKYNIMINTHTYSAAVGTPFTATLMVDKVDNTMANAVTGNYLVKIETDNLDARINIAIDKGLWWTYTQGNNHSYTSYAQAYDGTTPLMTWYTTNVSNIFTFSPYTASAIHAFGINNHKINGDPDKDPYVEAVQLGMNYLIKGYNYYKSSPALKAVAIATQHGSDNPDGNSNGYGIENRDMNGDRMPYEGGQVMDAIIAAGVLPTDLTGRDFTNITNGTIGHNWTYGELLQDMADMYAWGQSDDSCSGGTCGSWWYGWNYSSGDNSASQWAAIGMLPAQHPPWNVIVPNWVKTYNANWLAASYCSGSHYFGYNSACGCAGDSCQQTTTSGMVQMAFAGQNTSDTKWVGAQQYIADGWSSFMNSGSTWGGVRTYGWYSFAKAMRLSVPSPVTTITKSNTHSFDWYRGGSVLTSSDANYDEGLAPRIVRLQSADGSWAGNLAGTQLVTPWMIITLRPTLFASAPIACFTAAPNPSYPNMDITFDPSCSGHSETGKTIANLTKFEWDWNNDGIFDTSSALPAVQTHQFACASVPCSYPVTLQVTDDNTPALTATNVVTIDITNPPHPPVANAGGPYTTSLCVNDSLMLNGSKSFDQDEGQHEAGCSTCPNDTITAWDWDLVSPLTFDVINKSGKTVALTSAEIASFFTAGSHDIGLRVTDNTALAYPSSGQPNLANANFGTVDVKTGCICNLTARSKSGKIQLTWKAVAGAGSYDIYRSTAGPNTGFAKIATGVVTSYATYLDGTVVNGTKYYYRVLANTGCGSNAASATPSVR